ncbi:MAG TPA: hypothetical protein VED20_18335 [Streptosporangiaceae bacterium]|nr:hypothetical protein [Streptosporangiaceae bacterium]
MTLVKKPSETVTGASPEVLLLERAPAVLPLELAVVDADEEQPASSKAAPAMAAAVIRRIL